MFTILLTVLKFEVDDASFQGGEASAIFRRWNKKKEEGKKG